MENNKDSTEQTNEAEETKQESLQNDEQISADGNAEANEENGEDNEVEQLQKLLDEAKQNLLLERADFINFRKRSSQEKADMQTRITGNFLQEMLPAMDAFDQLFAMREKNLSQKQDADKTAEQTSEQTPEQTPEQTIKQFFEGIDLIYQQLWNVFSQADFEEINPIDEEFDPNVMEALAVEERDGIDKETVVQVYQKGFRNKDRVLRPARVVVAKPKSGEKTSQKKEA